MTPPSTLQAGERFIRENDLAAVKLDQIRDEVYAVAGVGAFTPDGDDYGLEGAAARKAVNRTTSRRKIRHEFLSRVAEIHQSAPEGVRLPAVKAAFSVEERQALRYIAQARQKGLIDGNS